MGSGLYRRSWTSLPTAFISAQRLSELPVCYVCVETNVYVKKHIIFKHFQTYAVFSLYACDHDEVTV